VKALLWRYLEPGQKTFKEYIPKAMDLCITGKSTISSPTDHIERYTLSIACGYIHHSDYGQDLMKGLVHVHHELRAMNADNELRKELSSALGSKLFWNKKEKALLRTTIRFSALMNAFISEVQRAIKSTNGPLVSDAPDFEEKGDSDALQVALLNKLSVKSSGIDERVYLSEEWIPQIHNGYYFGNIGGDGVKYSVLSTKDFGKLLDVAAEQTVVQIDESVLINMKPVVVRFDAPLVAPDDDMKAEIESKDADPASFQFKTVCSILSVDEVYFEMMELAVHDHRGHYSDYGYHPKNLLDGRSATYYYSKRGKPAEDWIILEKTSGKSVRPTVVMLRNTEPSSALRTLTVSCSDDQETWHTLRQIDGIKQDKEKRQFFSIDAQTGRELKEDMKFLKLHQFENYGDDDVNRFREFGVFGVPE